MKVLVTAPLGQLAAHAPQPQQCDGDSNSVGISPLFTVDMQLPPLFMNRKQLAQNVRIHITEKSQRNCKTGNSAQKASTVG